MAFVRSSCPFTRVLIIFCIIPGVMAKILPDSGCNKYTGRGVSDFVMTCNSPYILNTIHTLKCEIGHDVRRRGFCTTKRTFLISDVGFTLLPCKRYEGTPESCQTGKPTGEFNCVKGTTSTTYTCSFNLTQNYSGKTMACMELCTANSVTKSCAMLLNKEPPCGIDITIPPTTEAPPTTAPPPTTSAPEKEFPIWAAILIALGIAGLIALCVCLVWRKRRQAQRPAQAPEGGNAENPEGEEAEGERENDDGEEEESEGTKSADGSGESKESAAEGGEEAPEEQ